MRSRRNRHEQRLKGGEIMSFASRTKKELRKLKRKIVVLRSEVAAFIRMNGALSFSNKQSKPRCPN